MIHVRVKHSPLIVLAILMLVASAVAQFPTENPMVYQKWNTFQLNKVSTVFNNTGLISDGNEQNMPLARMPSMEYPTGSGVNYGTSIGVVVGAPFPQLPGAWSGNDVSGLPFLDGSMDEGSAAFWSEEHFAPYPGFLANDKVAMSDDTTSWPNQWPTAIPGSGRPLLVGSEGWPGFGPGGERIAEVESFAASYGWPGTDYMEGGGTGQDVRWLNTEVTTRGLAWSGSLYEDFIIWVYTIENIGTDPLTDLRVGVHSDFGFLPEFYSVPYYDDDRHYYDPTLQLAYGSDDNGYEVKRGGAVLSADEIAWGGTMVLRMPGGDHAVHTYDVFHFWQGATTAAGNGASPELYYRYNLVNENDPQDSNGDGIDDDFDGDGIPDADNGGPGYAVESGADGVQTLGSAPFTLNPGEIDTLIFVTVMGDNRADLLTNAKRAKGLYENNWQPLTPPPAPVMESKVNDREVDLYWSYQETEADPEFEGYKIYRSSDGGVTWGSQSFTDFDGSVHYIPIAQYDLDDNIKGNYSTLPEYAWYYLGDDTGLPNLHIVTAQDGLTHFEVGDTVRTFTDHDVTNGLEYRFYVAAYDSGNGIYGPLENTAANNPTLWNNTVKVVPNIPGATTATELADIKVVPNPYVGGNAWENGNNREIQFTHLPDRATIIIFNAAGEKVRTLEHEASTAKAPSIAVWNLLNDDDQLVAPGIYFYYLKSEYGSKTGKMVVIL